MKLTTILTESKHEQIITPEYAKKLISTECSDSKDVNLYRGSSGRFEAAIVTASEYERPRSSQTGKSLMMELTSNLPSWSEYPPRNRSLFFSTDPDQAFEWGTVYKVYPKNGSTVAIAPTVDFNFSGSFAYMNEMLGTHDGEPTALLQRVVEELLDVICELTGDHHDVMMISLKDVTEMNKVVEQSGHKFDELLKMSSLPPTVQSLNPTSFLDLIDKLLDPTKNGYKLVKTSQLQSVTKSLPYPREMWCSDPCVLNEY